MKQIELLEENAPDNIEISADTIEDIKEGLKEDGFYKSKALTIAYNTYSKCWEIIISPSERKSKIIRVYGDGVKLDTLLEYVLRGKGNVREADNTNSWKSFDESFEYLVTRRGYGGGVTVSWVHIRDKNGWDYDCGDAFNKVTPSKFDVKSVARLNGIEVEYTKAEEKKLTKMLEENILVPLSKKDQDYFGEKLKGK